MIEVKPHEEFQGYPVKCEICDATFMMYLTEPPKHICPTCKRVLNRFVTNIVKMAKKEDLE